MHEKSKFIWGSVVLLSIIFIFSIYQNNNDRLEYEKFLKQEYKEIAYQPNPSVKHFKPTYPDKAAIQNYFMTLDPALKKVPTERLKHAFAETKSIQKSSRLKAVSSDIQWEEVPSYMAGRVRAMMFDPNDANQTKVFAGAATGGLWYNDDITNVNSSWEIVDNFWGSLAVGCITHDPNNPQVFYAGTGEAQTALTIYRESSGVGVGIYKSNDGGDTWELLPSTSDFKYVTGIVVKNEDGNSVIYAGVVSGFYKGSAHQSTPTDGLYRSDDGGQNWQQVLPDIIGSDVPYAPADIKVSSSGRIFVGTMKNLNNEGGSAILYSDDGTPGSWVIFDDYETTIKNHSTENIPGRVVLATAPSNPNRVYAVLDAGFIHSFDNLQRSEGKFILKSNNAGESWTRVNNPTTISRHWAPIGWHALCVIVHPEDEDVVFVGGLDCFKSSNAGSSWNQLSYWGTSTSYQYIHADIHNYTFNPNNSNHLLVCTDGGVFYSANSTANVPTFRERNKDFNCLQFYSCAIDPRAGHQFYIGGLQDNGTVYYNGQPISGSTGISGGDGAYCFINKNHPNSIITSVYHNLYYFFYTLDNYLGYNRIYYDNGSGIFINPADLDHNNNILYANATSFKNDYKNTLVRYKNTRSNITSGSSFINITSGVNVPFSHIKVSPHTTNSSKLYVGTESGRLFKVNNADSNPSSSEIGDNNFPLGNISCVAIGGSEDTLLVTFSNYGVSSVWQTYDGGSTWNEKEGNLPDMPVRWAIYEPNNAKEALLATELGVWYTDELDQNNPEWIPVNDGLANVRVDMLQIRESDHKVLAATHGRGLATTTFGTVGVRDDVERDSDKIVIAPNPSSGKFTLRFNAFNAVEAEISIFNMNGRLIYSEYLGRISAPYSKDVDISSQSKGQYILRLKAGDKFYTKKIILF